MSELNSFNREEGGKDLRKFHVGRYYKIPEGFEYKIASFIRQVERATTPIPEETEAMEDLPEIIPSSKLVTVKKTSESAVPVDRRVKVKPESSEPEGPMISYGNQSTFSGSPISPYSRLIDSASFQLDDAT